MREIISDRIKKCVSEFESRENTKTSWRDPIVGFANVQSDYIQKMQIFLGPEHELPEDILDDAKIVVAYFLPFTKELVKLSSDKKYEKQHVVAPEWALAYEETNTLIVIINRDLIEFLSQKGYKAAFSIQSMTFDKEKLISHWSQRHFAYAAGLGTFGINNMLITKVGCCGRYSTVITNLDVEADQPVEGEYCLYKKKGTCGICMKHCPAGALTPDGYDRNACYGICKENAVVYTDFGSSYMDETGENANSVGSEVCGKCVTGSPCAIWNLK